MWTVALLLFVVVWAGTRGWLPALPVDVALAPAAAALAASVSLGAAAFELDLPGYRFGWRQLAATVAGLALGVASVPVVAASFGGRWKLPSADASSVLAFLPGDQSGDYRVLWVGAPESLPLAGRQLSAGTAYATSYNGLPTLTDQWLSSPAGATHVLGSDLALVQRGLTTEVGHLLAPAGVRYIVVANRNAPAASGGLPGPVPVALLVGLSVQTDLDTVQIGDTAYTVFENAAWAPARAILAPGVARFAGSPAASDPRALQQVDLTGSSPAVSGTSRSVLVPGSTVYYGATRTAGWRLDSSGHEVAAEPAFGWAMSFKVPQPEGGSSTGTPARLTYSSPLSIRAGDLLAILLWVGAGALLIFYRRRRASGPAPSRPHWFRP